MYTVLFAIQCDDGRRYEPGPSDLPGATMDEARAWLANGWLAGARVIVTPDLPAETAPSALPHFYGAGDAPAGTWEAEHQHDNEE